MEKKRKEKEEKGPNIFYACLSQSHFRPHLASWWSVRCDVTNVQHLVVCNSNLAPWD